MWGSLAETEARQMIPSVLDIILEEAEDVSKARTQQEPSTTFTKPMGVGPLGAGADSSRRKGSIRDPFEPEVSGTDEELEDDVAANDPILDDLPIWGGGEPPGSIPTQHPAGLGLRDQDPDEAIDELYLREQAKKAGITEEQMEDILRQSHALGISRKELRDTVEGQRRKSKGRVKDYDLPADASKTAKRRGFINRKLTPDEMRDPSLTVVPRAMKVGPGAFHRQRARHARHKSAQENINDILYAGKARRPKSSGTDTPSDSEQEWADALEMPVEDFRDDSNVITQEEHDRLGAEEAARRKEETRARLHGEMRRTKEHPSEDAGSRYAQRMARKRSNEKRFEGEKKLWDQAQSAPDLAAFHESMKELGIDVPVTRPFLNVRQPEPGSPQHKEKDPLAQKLKNKKVGVKNE